jgi:hypothetical protein
MSTQSRAATTPNGKKQAKLAQDFFRLARRAKRWRSAVYIDVHKQGSVKRNDAKRKKDKQEEV